MNNQKQLLFECEKCGKKFNSVKDGKIHFDIPFTVARGQKIYITYYSCPLCGHTHYVQVDDDKSLAMKNEVVGMFMSFSKLRLDGDRIPKSRNERFVNANNKLESYRLKLMKRFEGKIAKDSGGNEVELRFSCFK